MSKLENQIFTQRQTPNRDLKNGENTVIQETSKIVASSPNIYKREIKTQPKRDKLKKKHSLGFQVEINNDPNEITEESEDFTTEDMNFKMNKYYKNAHHTPVKIVKLHRPGKSWKIKTEQNSPVKLQSNGKKI